MIDIENKTHTPSVDELCAFTQCPLFDELCAYMEREYHALRQVDFSSEKQFYGWNLKFRKAGRTLCTVYPRQGFFILLVVVGRREKERAEARLSAHEGELARRCRDTREVMGQRWLMLELSAHTEAYDDALSLIRIRRESGKGKTP